MRINTAIAALMIAAATLVQLPVRAEADGRAQLRLVVVDQANVPMPSATVTVYTMDGKPGVTVTANDKGVALFPSLATGVAQIHARTSGYSPYIDKTTLQSGDNAQTVTLYTAKQSS